MEISSIDFRQSLEKLYSHSMGKLIFGESEPPKKLGIKYLSEKEFTSYLSVVNKGKERLYDKSFWGIGISSSLMACVGSSLPKLNIVEKYIGLKV